MSHDTTTMISMKDIPKKDLLSHCLGIDFSTNDVFQLDTYTILVPIFSPEFFKVIKYPSCCVLSVGKVLFH